MLAEVWQIICFGVATAIVGSISTILTIAIKSWLKSRSMKRSEEANADVATVEAETAKLGLFKQEFDMLKEHKAWALTEFDRLEKLFRTEKAASNKRYEEYETEIDRVKKVYTETLEELEITRAEKESERLKKEFFKSLLGSLINFVMVTCPKAEKDLVRYKKAIEENEDNLQISIHGSDQF